MEPTQSFPSNVYGMRLGGMAADVAYLAFMDKVAPLVPDVAQAVGVQEQSNYSN